VMEETPHGNNGNGEHSPEQEQAPLPVCGLVCLLLPDGMIAFRSLIPGQEATRQPHLHELRMFATDVLQQMQVQAILRSSQQQMAAQAPPAVMPARGTARFSGLFDRFGRKKA
jgi:hypothetical protein